MVLLEAEIAGLLTDARKRGTESIWFADPVVMPLVQDGWKKQCCSAWPARGSSWVPRQLAKGVCVESVEGDGFSEVVSASGSGACPSAPLPEPAIFLVHRSTSQAGRRLRKKVDASPNSFRGSRRGEVARCRLYVWVQFPRERLSELFRVASRQSEAPKIFDPKSHFSRRLNESAT